MLVQFKGNRSLIIWILTPTLTALSIPLIRKCCEAATLHPEKSVCLFILLWLILLADCAAITTFLFSLTRIERDRMKKSVGERGVSVSEDRIETTEK